MGIIDSDPLMLRIAVEFWGRDMEPPIDVIAHLTELGYDVAALEREYRK